MDGGVNWKWLQPINSLRWPMSKRCEYQSGPWSIIHSGLLPQAFLPGTDRRTNKRSAVCTAPPTGRSTGIKRIKRFYRLRSKERASRKLFLRFYRGACNGRLEKIPRSQPLRHERIIEIYAVCRYWKCCRVPWSCSIVEILLRQL